MHKDAHSTSTYEALAKAIRYRVEHSQYHIKHVLIIDDARDFAHGIKEFLRHRIGLNVGVVTSSQEAYALIRSANSEGRPFQLIISDLELGADSDDGLTILKTARGLCPTVKTILMSSIATTAFQPCEHADFTLHKDTRDMLTELLLLIDRLEVSLAISSIKPKVEDLIR